MKNSQIVASPALVLIEAIRAVLRASVKLSGSPSVCWPVNQSVSGSVSQLLHLPVACSVAWANNQIDWG